MPTVFIPPLLRRLTDDRQSVQVEGTTLREVVDALEARYPGVREKLCHDDEVRPELSVSIGDNLISHGLAEPVPPNSEIHFLPALGGG